MRKGLRALILAIPLYAASPKIPTSSQPTWTVDIGLHPMYRTQPPILQDGRLIFIAHNDFRNHLYALDAASGAIAWQSPFRATRVDYFSDDSLRVFTLDRYYLGLHAKTGVEFDGNDLLNQPGIYESKYLPLFSDGLTLITAPTGDLVALSPGGQKWKASPGWHSSIDATALVPYKDLVLTGSVHSSTNKQGGLKAYRQLTGVLEWNAPEVKDATAIKVHGDVVLVYEGHWSDPSMYIPTVRALNGATGKQLWELATGEKYTAFAWAVEKSQSDGDILVMPCSSDPKGPFTLRVVDLHTGAPKFQFSLDAAGFAVSKGVVYAVDGKQVAAIDPMSGTVLWRSSPFAERPVAPFAGDGFVYAADRHVLSAWAVK